MRIQVKKGAVITLLVDFQNNYNLEGAVVSISDNEIILQPQWYIAKEHIQDSRGFIDYTDITQEYTMDSPYPEIHVDRKHIIGWCYSRLPTEKTAERTVFSGFYTWKEQIPSKLHFYNKGICEGSGEILD